MVVPAGTSARVRKDVATLGSGWNPDLLWYAKAVQKLWEKGPGDRTGWRYLGAIHGFERDLWVQRGIISPGDLLPPASEQGMMWDQCQHQGWYFLPWHRGYLAAFEAIVAATIQSEGGPEDWALPYWNYFDTNNSDARSIPDVFREETLPDGSPNPLASPPRQGTVLGPQPGIPDISLTSMRERIYTSPPGGRAFGGGITGFNQFGGKTGAMEANPHNNVHVMIGGLAEPVGFMSDPELAGLDPIFWLHHCNIDRLWAAWLTRSANVMENGQEWRDGPFPRRFQMPTPDGNLVVFTPAECLPGGALAPTYDDMTIGTGAASVPAAVGEEEAVPARLSNEAPIEARLAGANAESLTVRPAEAIDTSVELAEEETTVAGVQDERVILNLENIRGDQPSGALNIYVAAPGQGAGLASVEEPYESVALFGLAKASASHNLHGGNGISVAVDITSLVNRLAREVGDDLRRLDVRIEQPGEGARPITVGRVSIYKQPVS